MGLFDKFKKNAKAESKISLNTEPIWPAMAAATAKGIVVPMEQIPDKVFSTGVMGQCCGIKPAEGKVYSPVEGKVSLVADTLHAVGIEGSNGVEFLVHVGIDTVDMNGDGFDCKVKKGDKVKKGQMLLTMDLDKIRGAGHETDVITIVTNSDEYSAITLEAAGNIMPGDDLMKICK